jgi:1,4-dihydroxy-2-naphthoate octaprenyltransferase
VRKHTFDRWGQAIAAEMIFWLLGVALLCFAVTLNIKLTEIVFVSSVVVYFTAVPRIKRRAAASNKNPKSAA